MSVLLNASTASYIAGLGVALVVYGLFTRKTLRNTLPFPPGPKSTLPFIGNLFDLPTHKAWLTFRDWHAQYGEIVSLDVLGRKIMILGSRNVVDELMERRSAVYSDRPWSIMAQELMDIGFMLTIMPYGDRWRQARKTMFSFMSPTTAPDHHPLQLEGGRRFARDLLSAKQDVPMLEALVRNCVFQTFFKCVYGADINGFSESKYVKMAEKTLHAFVISTLPGNFWVDFMPFLRYVPSWFPGARFQRYAREINEESNHLSNASVDLVKTGMDDGTAPPSMTRTLLEDNAERGLVKDAMSNTYLGGSDTTASTIMTFFLAMLVHPEMQKRAQAEIDRVVGPNRLPEMDDQENLPYVQAVISECLRWIPVTPLAAPHMTTQDDTYNGYFIPKGTIIIGSVWGLLHNPDDYPDPESFNPGRYLTPEGTIDPSVRNPRTSCFGFARRVCPGRFMLEGSLFGIIATVLATVDIVRAKDANGNEIVPDVDVSGGVLNHANPFPWSVRPRSRQAEELLANALAA